LSQIAKAGKWQKISRKRERFSSFLTATSCEHVETRKHEVESVVRHAPALEP
jgi:hypothetical protein